MQKEESKFSNSTVFEGMTSIRAVLVGGYSENNDRKIEKILYDPEKTAKIGKNLGYLKAISSERGFTVEEANREYLDSITLGNSHGGLVAICSERAIPYLTDKDITENGFYAMIEGIEDPYNFGYSLRSLYPCGCDGIILSERNWMSAAGVVCRSSAGASELFKMYKLGDEGLIETFKNKGYKIVCADERTENILGECELKKPLVLIVGGEKRGISRSILSKADTLVKIPYEREFKASLSAASATTMFAYEIMRQNKK